MFVLFVFFPIINFKYLDKRSSKQCDWNTDYKFSCSRVCPSWRRCRRWPGAESLSVTVSSRRRRWEPSSAAGQTPRWGWTSVCVRGYSLPGAGRCWSPVCVWVSRCWRSPETRCSMTARKSHLIELWRCRVRGWMSSPGTVHCSRCFGSPLGPEGKCLAPSPWSPHHWPNQTLQDSEMTFAYPSFLEPMHCD